MHVSKKEQAHQMLYPLKQFMTDPKKKKSILWSHNFKIQAED